MSKESRIRILSESLANQIAAGEVVQRPASLLKELVENSIDAGAARVEIDLESGGAARVQVVDDGYGMSEDDALLCLERHATSKIATDWDLGRVATLGFRGEALPSIAAVSKMTITTRRPGDALGTEVRVEGGKLQRVTEMGAAPGTRVEARSLFYNVPARRKFLKRKETELARCLEASEPGGHGEPGRLVRSAPRAEDAARSRRLRRASHPCGGACGRGGGFPSAERSPAPRPGT